MVCCVAVQAQLVTYPEGLQTGMSHNDDYTVRVRVPGGDWKDLFEYNVQVDMDRVQVFFRQYSQMCSFPIANHSSMMQHHSYKLLLVGRLMPGNLWHKSAQKFQMRLYPESYIGYC